MLKSLALVIVLGLSMFTCALYIFQDVAVELTEELSGKPDFIIGNYTDGNLVASLLSHKLGVTQVSKIFCVWGLNGEAFLALTVRWC